MNKNTIKFLENWAFVLRDILKGDRIRNADSYAFKYCIGHPSEALDLLHDLKANYKEYADMLELHPDRMRCLITKISETIKYNQLRK